MVAVSGELINQRRCRAVLAGFAEGFRSGDGFPVLPVRGKSRSGAGNSTLVAAAGERVRLTDRPHGTTFNAETAELAEQDRFSLRVPRVLR
jgi:hypothetical protein